MFDLNLIKNILLIAIASSIISTALLQRLKVSVKHKEKFCFVCFVISMIIGVSFSLCFSNLSIINSLWVGLINYIGADAIYKTFEDKIFSSFSSMEDIKEIERDDIK